MEKNIEANALVINKAESEKLEKELERLLALLKVVRHNRKNNIITDKEWYDKYFSSINIEESMIVAEINRVKKMLNTVVRTDDEVLNSNIINLGDVVELNLTYGEDSELMLVKLELLRNGTDSDIPVIGVESPLGKAIYKQEVGNVVNYSVNGVSCSVSILSKVNSNVNVKEVKTK